MPLNPNTPHPTPLHPLALTTGTPPPLPPCTVACPREHSETVRLGRNISRQIVGLFLGRPPQQVRSSFPLYIGVQVSWLAALARLCCPKRHSQYCGYQMQNAAGFVYQVQGPCSPHPSPQNCHGASCVATSFAKQEAWRTMPPPRMTRGKSRSPSICRATSSGILHYEWPI